jgi:hypothetical protein
MVFKILPEQSKPPSLTKESFHRLPAQAVAGVASTVPGIFGDIGSTINEYIAGPISKAITGKKPVPYEQTLIGKALPTSAKHMENLERAIPYLKPKNKIEKFVRDVSADAISLAIPGAGLTRIGLRAAPPMRNLLISIGANAGGELTSQFTGDEKKGAFTKMGLMFLGSILNKPNVYKEVGKLYQKADDLLPRDAAVNSHRLNTELNGLKNKVLQGRQPADLAPSEKFVIDQADTILRQTETGQVNVNTLKSSLRSLNENLQKFVYEAPDKSIRVRARKMATQINGHVNRTLADYGRTNPEWWKFQKGANQAFGTIQQSQFVTNFINNHFKGNSMTHGLLHALGVPIENAVAPYQAVKILYRIAKSPELAKIYSRILGSAASENAPIMNKEIKKLDERLQKEKSKNRYRILD